MITHVRIQNFRSFLDAEIDLQPFSLIVGANGSGKSNFLKFFNTISLAKLHPYNTQQGEHRFLQELNWQKHYNSENEACAFELTTESEKIVSRIDPQHGMLAITQPLPFNEIELPIFNINADLVAAIETAIPTAVVGLDGRGTAQVLDMLKNGDREDLFELIEKNFRRYVPEVEKISLKTIKDGQKQIQLREIGIQQPVPATALSEGTRLILCILTILHQENPPQVILLEDVDRGMHPRLFEYVAPLMRDIAERHQINILATTHNPYLVDCFQDNKEAVIIVEKKDGASTLTTLAKKLEGLDYETVDPEDMPLGTLWYSGLVGGAPKTPRSVARS